MWIRRRKVANEKLTQKAKDHVQQAGDNSQQIQASTVIINNGINEIQARELYSEMSKKAMQEYTAESHLLIEKRIADFANVLIPRIEKIENGFESFADPEFQLELRKAQVSSACTDKEADYEMLSELLLHRIENKDSRRVKASISKAVEIVDKIDDESLTALTVVYSVLKLLPLSGSIKSGFETMDMLLNSVANTELPNDYNWISYLDILDVLRPTSFGKFKKLSEYYFETLTGYTAVGIHKDSANYQKAKEILAGANMNIGVLIDHELLDGYVRLPIPEKGNYQGMSLVKIVPNTNVFVPIKVEKRETEVLDKIWELYSNVTDKKDNLKTNFINLWNQFNNLKKIETWWNSLPSSFNLTPIGYVLAHANAQRLNKDVPKFQGC